VATFKEISAADVKTSRSVLNQLVDVIQEDISGSATRKKYQLFVTGGVGPGVTSSLYHTVYDQDFSLQTANSIFDTTVGLYVGGTTVVSSSTGIDSAGKYLFPSQSMMMREKIDIYQQYAASLLGDASSFFTTPFGSSTSTDIIDSAVFISFKRLFTRDKIKRETFAMRMHYSSSLANGGAAYADRNLNVTSELDERIYTDFGAATNRRRTFGGEVGDLVNAADTTDKVGLVFYDSGTVVLNVDRIISSSQPVSGVISAMRAGASGDVPTGRTIIGGTSTFFVGSVNPTAKFVPDLMVSASVDDIVDHFMSCRFSSGSLTAQTFQNNTNINSTLLFCRATADEFNYSSNPTYTDSSNRVVVIDEGQEDVQRSFSFITTVGLYDANDNLLAVAKLSRPIEKNDEKDLTVRIRLDF
tara:strand:- start:415 stop:1656 length:1242 start_codon:yes stop_codon:yes gene_type:complete